MTDTQREEFKLSPGPINDVGKDEAEQRRIEARARAEARREESNSDEDIDESPGC